jgi:hypothetical protein
MVGRLDGWMDGWMHGWMDGWMVCMDGYNKAKCLNYQGLDTSKRRSRSRDTRLGS